MLVSVYLIVLVAAVFSIVMADRATAGARALEPESTRGATSDLQVVEQPETDPASVSQVR